MGSNHSYVSGWENLYEIGTVKNRQDGVSYSTYDAFNVAGPSKMELKWRTYQSTAYQRIESYFEAVEKLNAAYENDDIRFRNQG